MDKVSLLRGLFKRLKDKKVIAITGHIGQGKSYLAKELCNILSAEYDVAIFSFATPIKTLAREIAGVSKVLNYVDIERLRNLTFKEFQTSTFLAFGMFNEEIGRQYFTQIKNLAESISDRRLLARKLFQILGDFGREMDKDLFAKSLVVRTYRFFLNRDISEYNLGRFQIPPLEESKKVIIPDLRFLNEERVLREYIFPKDALIIIRKERPLKAILEDLQVDEETYKKMLDHNSEKEVDMISADLTIGDI